MGGSGVFGTIRSRNLKILLKKRTRGVRLLSKDLCNDARVFLFCAGSRNIYKEQGLSWKKSDKKSMKKFPGKMLSTR